MSSPAEIIYQLLGDLGLTGPAWPAYISFMPDSPDQVIAIYDDDGRQDGRIMSSGEQIEHPGVTVLVRGQLYSETFAKAEAIAKAFDGVRNVLVAPTSSDQYIVTNISRTSTVIALGIEEQDRSRRHLFRLSMVLTLRKT